MVMHTAPGSEVGTLKDNGTICRLGAQFSESCHDWCLEHKKGNNGRGVVSAYVDIRAVLVAANQTHRL